MSGLNHLIIKIGEIALEELQKLNEKQNLQKKPYPNWIFYRDSDANKEIKSLIEEKPKD